jgi:tRNA threonylcarbamoyladenosine modification (KEOPS) complex  Pcc1 subunit
LPAWEDNRLEHSSDIQPVRAIIRLDMGYDTQELVLAALKPEFVQQHPNRSSALIDGSHGELIIKVKARDLSSFRASLASILRLINVVVEMQRVVREKE